MTTLPILLASGALLLVAGLWLGFTLRIRARRRAAEEAALDGLAREAALRIATAEQRQARRDRRRPGRLLH